MLIDWFTVSAQIVNFLILVWLLKRFLYKPILRAIDEREKQIASQLAAAKAQKAEAQKEQTDFEGKNKALDQEREAVLKKATEEAQSERQRLLDDARKEADVLRLKLRETIKSERDHVGREVIRRTRREVFAIARKTLADLASVEVEERLGDVFVRRLHGLSGPEKEQFGAVLKKSSQPLRVRSAFAMPPAQRTLIESAIKETFANELPIEFETAPDLIGGIELATDGQKVAWSIEDYLGSLAKSVDQYLDAKTQSP